MSKVQHIVMALSGSLLLAYTSPSAAEIQVIDFDGMGEGAPAGFTTTATGQVREGEWVVRREPDAPSGAQVLAQISDEPGRSKFPLAIWDGIEAADVDVSVRFKPIAGEIDQAAGLVWRYMDRDNYYIVRANALEGNVVLYKVENGRRTDLPLVGKGRTYGVEVPVLPIAGARLRCQRKAIASRSD